MSQAYDSVPGAVGDGQRPSLALAIDVGGTKMAAGTVDANGVVHSRAQTETPATTDAAIVFAAIARVVESALATIDRATLAVCGVACGGPMSPGGERVSPLHIPAWRDFALRDAVRDLTALDVFVDGDAKAIALAEGWRGAAAGVDAFIGMVVSTGVGGGIVVDRRLLDGHTGNAGHIGHVIVEPDGHACFCGGHGCLEAEVSGRAIAALTGRPATDAGDETIHRSGTLVGRAIASVANLLDLQLAVIGGSVALGFGPPFFDAAQAEIDARSRLSFSAGTRVVPAALGISAPLVGAAAVGWRGLGGVEGIPG